MRFERSSKSRGVFRTQASIEDGAFLWIYWTAYFFRNISSIIDVRLSYILASENIETFKVKLRWSKSSGLLQRVAFLVWVPTCYKNPKNPSCIDLILTNSQRSFQSSCAIETGLSDFHRLTVTVMKAFLRKLKPKVIHYRNYKRFCNKSYRND